jgi:hypothetical protein
MEVPERAGRQKIQRWSGFIEHWFWRGGFAPGRHGGRRWPALRAVRPLAPTSEEERGDHQTAGRGVGKALSHGAVSTPFTEVWGDILASTG